MTNTQLHYTFEQLNLLLDKKLTEAERADMQQHFFSCNACRHAFEGLARIDGALKGLPQIETSPDFTRRVMNLVLVKPPVPHAFRVLEKMSYVFGMLIVLGVLIAAFVVTGAFDASQVDQTKALASGIVENIGNGISSGVGRFTALLVQYLPFTFGKGSIGVACFAVVVVAMLAAVDRVVGRRVLQR